MKLFLELRQCCLAPFVDETVSMIHSTDQIGLGAGAGGTSPSDEDHDNQGSSPQAGPDKEERLHEATHHIPSMNR
jgi:hypothetical protein